MNRDLEAQVKQMGYASKTEAVRDAIRKMIYGPAAGGKSKVMRAKA